METWQEVLKKNSISSLEALAAKFGPEHFPDLERLRLAAEQGLGGAADGGFHVHQAVRSDAMTRVRISSSSTVGSYPTRARTFSMSGTRRGMSSNPAS